MPARRPLRVAQDRLRQPRAVKKRRFLTQETLREKIARANEIVGRLGHAYPRIRVPLEHRNTFELLVATILSAQCTDEAVNKITPELFRRYPDPEALAHASTDEIENVIRSLGLFRAKARALKQCAGQLLEKFASNVPFTMQELTQLTGVGRKTANVILGHAFGAPAMIVDTHCRRVARRLAFTREQDPGKIERDLSRLLPPSAWTSFSHRLILHGRRVCFARKPDCVRCVLLDACPTGIATVK